MSFIFLTKKAVVPPVGPTLWAWGQNSQGQLGQGDLVNRSSPTQVGSDTNWSSLGIASFTSTALVLKTS